MKIRPKNFNQNQILLQVFEHVMITILILVVSFASIFFYGIKSESDFLLDLIGNYLLYSYTCVAIVVIIQVIYFLKIVAKNNIRYFDFDDDSKIVTLGICKSYSNAITEIQIKYEELSYGIGKSLNLTSLSVKTEVEFFDKYSLIANLEPKGLIWNSDQLLIRKILLKLKLLNIPAHKFEDNSINIQRFLIVSFFGNREFKNSKKQ